MKFVLARILMLISLLFLASCQDGSIDDFSPKATRPLPQKILDKMKAKGMNRNAPIYIRLFKDEHVVEVWKQKTSGRYDMISNYNICAWSGTLGPKVKQGDRQAPEGFYPIKPHNMNPASKYFLALNTGFPNAYDRSHGRSGSDLMIHGACSSSGCYSVTDDNVAEIYAFARDAFAGGQQEIMLELLPFRMTPEKMAVYREHKAFGFWNMVKEGYDYFELTKMPPQVGFCEKKYVFNRGLSGGNGTEACPAPVQTAFAATYAGYQSKWQTAYASAAKKFENTPHPIVMGGKSRPLTKKWKPQPVKKEKTAQLPTPVRGSAETAVAETVIAPTATPEAETAVAVAPVAERFGDQPTPNAVAKSEPSATTEQPAAAATAETTSKAEGQTLTATPTTASAVPVPQADPRDPAASDAAVAAEPVKKKKLWWPFNGS